MAPTFHGRDWFAPAAIRWICGQELGLSRIQAGSMVGADWSDELARILYIDRFGNLMTGLRAEVASDAWILHMAGRRISHARTFSDVPIGHPFWYENALGLIEIAVNQGRADLLLAMSAGDAVGPFGPDA
jgi:S-adenosylmethionine hydrolase